MTAGSCSAARRSALNRSLSGQLTAVVNSGTDFELIEGSGNVFRDFGDPEANLKQVKAILAARIIAALDGRGLPVRKVGALTRFAAARASRAFANRTSGASRRTGPADEEARSS